MAAPRPMPSASARTQRNGDVRRRCPRTCGQPVGHQQRVGHRDEADQRADRQVDVARDDDQHHAGRDDRDARRPGRPCVTMLVGWISLPPLRMWNVEQDDDQRDEHAEQAEVDLRLRRAGRGSRSGRAAAAWPDTGAASATFVTPALLGCRCEGSDLRPRGVPGARRSAALGSDGRTTVYLQAAGAVAASTPLQRSALVIWLAVDDQLQVVRRDRRGLQDERLDRRCRRAS